jgi:serine/threonine protein kinase
VRSVYILQHLNHPNIIRLVNYIVPVEYDMSIYLLYESGKKGSLEDIKKHLRLHKMHSVIKLIMYELAEALSYLKSVNVAHRDIKVPEIP